MRATLKELQAALPYATAVNMAGAAVNTQVDGISTDSRNVAAGNLFFALRGEHFDAHDFLPQVAAQGAAAVVVERLPPGLNMPALIVPDTQMKGTSRSRSRRRASAAVLLNAGML